MKINQGNLSHLQSKEGNNIIISIDIEKVKTLLTGQFYHMLKKGEIFLTNKK